MGQHKLTKFKKVEDAIKDFEKKFKDKTKNNWSDRENFIPHKGKYTLIEVDGEQDTEVKVNAQFVQTKYGGGVQKPKSISSCSWALPLQS